MEIASCAAAFLVLVAVMVPVIVTACIIYAIKNVKISEEYHRKQIKANNECDRLLNNAIEKTKPKLVSDEDVVHYRKAQNYKRKRILGYSAIVAAMFSYVALGYLSYNHIKVTKDCDEKVIAYFFPKPVAKMIVANCDCGK